MPRPDGGNRREGVLDVTKRFRTFLHSHERHHAQSISDGTTEVAMRRTLIMTRILTTLCVVCLTVLLNWQNHRDAMAEESLLHRESSILTPQHQHHQEATLTDASQLYRICSSRPQRILPTQGSKSERTITPFGNLAIRHHNVKPLYSHYDSRCRLETAPFCMSASCDYYVIALRHIIR